MAVKLELGNEKICKESVQILFDSFKWLQQNTDFLVPKLQLGNVYRQALLDEYLTKPLN